MDPISPAPTYSNRKVRYSFTYPNWNMTENINGAIVYYYCKDSYAYTDKTTMKSFHCEQSGNQGVWMDDQPADWDGCIGKNLT